MQISGQFIPGDLPVFVDSVRKAEECGYARVWLVDGQLLWRNVYIYMAHGLAATDRIMFSTAVTNPFTRHYTVTANAHATLAELHPGRVGLGIGRGDNAVRTLGLNPVATNQLKEVVPRMRDLMAGRSVDFNGKEIEILWAGQTDIPVMMPGTGPKNLRLAGQLADTVMFQVGVNPISVKWAIDHVHAGAEEAGRDPDEITIALYCAMWVSDDLEEARSMTRWAAACAANHIEDVVRRNPSHGMPAELSRIVELPRADYDWAGHLDPSVERSEYPDDIVNDFAFNGPPERIVEMLRALADVGVDEVAPCYLNGRFEQMEVVGREIIPQVAHLPA